jgi:hypothetical protein
MFGAKINKKIIQIKQEKRVKMAYKGKVVTLLVVLVLLGCKGVQPTSASTGAAVEGDGGMGAATGSAVTSKVAYITDPTLNDMNAISVRVPSRWQFKGWLAQGDTCVTIPAPIYTATSPDGVTAVEKEPDMVWKFGSGPMFDATNRKDCLPFKGPMSAQDFLKYYADSLNLVYVGPEPMPATILAADQAERDKGDAKAASLGIRLGTFKRTDDRARAIVTGHIGTLAIKGRLDAKVHCLTSDTPGGPQLVGRPARMTTGPSSTVTSCTASVLYLHSTPAKYAEVSRAFDATVMGRPDTVDSWVNAWLKRSNEQFRQNMAMIQQMMQRDLAAHAQEFQQEQASRQAMHDQFMDSFQGNFEAHQAQVNANMQARMTAASDVVDYAGDRQTVINPNTGIAYKIPNDVTVQQPLIKAHGDGTPW